MRILLNAFNPARSFTLYYKVNANRTMKRGAGLRPSTRFSQPSTPASGVEPLENSVRPAFFAGLALDVM
jgi:hypothetical protein